MSWSLLTIGITEWPSDGEFGFDGESLSAINGGLGVAENWGESEEP